MEGKRIRVKVSSVNEIRKGTSEKAGEWTALDFMAKATQNGEDVKYGIFKKHELYPHVKVDAVIDLEVVDKTRNVDGKDYTDHNVMNIYVNDKPVLQAPAHGGGGGYREDPVLKRRSVSLAYAKDYGIAMKYSVDQVLATATRFDQWIQNGK